jgi:threonine synthase
VISVPSGNFGNICAGILAKHSGLPVRHFIAACNANNVVTKYLQTEIFQIQPAVSTLSNAMDVGDPSNFIRILEIFHHQFPDLKRDLSSFSSSDEETLSTIREVYEKQNYLLDPHGAVGYLALQKYLHRFPEAKGIFLETAHPVKFPEAVETVTGVKIELPAAINSIMNKEKKSLLINKGYNNLKEYLAESI